jgi:hypothetical protein
MIENGVRVFHLCIATYLIGVLLFDMGRQSAVPGPLAQPLRGCAVAAQTVWTEPWANQCVAVHPYRTPLRRRTTQMAATMSFPGIAAVKPFEAEEAVLHRNRYRAGVLPIYSPGRKLFTTTGVNVVGSVPFYLGQFASTYRTSSVDWLFIWAVYDFKIPRAEREQVLHGR